MSWINVVFLLCLQGKFEHKERKNIRKEYNTHAKLQHPNIIKMLDSFEIVECIVIVTELAEIDLHGFMKKVKLSECHVKKLTCHLLSALHYLHTERILHRDLKPQNVLLNNYKNVEIMQAKLCDFGLARKMTTETFLLTSIKVRAIFGVFSPPFAHCSSISFTHNPLPLHLHTSNSEKRN